MTPTCRSSRSGAWPTTLRSSAGRSRSSVRGSPFSPSRVDALRGRSVRGHRLLGRPAHAGGRVACAWPSTHGHDLCFCASGKMFAAVDLEPPHPLSFKCTPEAFAELVERPGAYKAKHAGEGTAVGRSARAEGARAAAQDLVRAGGGASAAFAQTGGCGGAAQVRAEARLPQEASPPLTYVVRCFVGDAVCDGPGVRRTPGTTMRAPASSSRMSRSGRARSHPRRC